MRFQSIYNSLSQSGSVLAESSVKNYNSYIFWLLNSFERKAKLQWHSGWRLKKYMFISEKLGFCDINNKISPLSRSGIQNFWVNLMIHNFSHRFDGIMEAANAQFAAIKFQASRHSAAVCATSAQRERERVWLASSSGCTAALHYHAILLAPSVQLLLPCVCMRRWVYYHLVSARASIWLPNWIGGIAAAAREHTLMERNGRIKLLLDLYASIFIYSARNTHINCSECAHHSSIIWLFCDVAGTN
jgi:hypothetical protein